MEPCGSAAGEEGVCCRPASTEPRTDAQWALVHQ